MIIVAPALASQLSFKGCGHCVPWIFSWFDPGFAAVAARRDRWFVGSSFRRRNARGAWSGGGWGEEGLMTKGRGGGGVDCVGELAYKLASLSRVTKAGFLRRGWGELANALFCIKSCSTSLSRCSLDRRIFFAGTASLPVFLRSRQLESLSNQ